jgi:Family of unknown function (DUF6788)
MNPIQAIETRRNAILEEIRSIRSMKRGTINEQYFKGYLKGKKGAVTRGPYYVLSRREGARTVSQRLVSPQELQGAQQDVASYRRFVLLCREFEQLTEKLGELERHASDLTEEKKQPQSPSNRVWK